MASSKPTPSPDNTTDPRLDPGHGVGFQPGTAAQLRITGFFQKLRRTDRVEACGPAHVDDLTPLQPGFLEIGAGREGRGAHGIAHALPDSRIKPVDQPHRRPDPGRALLGLNLLLDLGAGHEHGCPRRDGEQVQRNRYGERDLQGPGVHPSTSASSTAGRKA